MGTEKDLNETLVDLMDDEERKQMSESLSGGQHMDASTSGVVQPPNAPGFFGGVPPRAPTYVPTSLLAPDVEISNVEVRLPPFWSDDPETWFVMVEAAFSLRRVSNKTKYLNLLTSLPHEVVRNVRDVLPKVPTDTSYNTLKTHILERLTPSNDERIDSLFYGCEMGDQKPSEFYRRLVQVAGESTELNINLVYKLWCRRLPVAVRHAIIPLEDRELSLRLEMADKIFEATRTASVCPVESGACALPRPDTQWVSRMDALSKEVGELRSLISEMTVNGRARSKSRGRNNNSQFRRTRSRSKPAILDSSICWYHAKYGDKATRCLLPCTYKSAAWPSGFPKN